LVVIEGTLVVIQKTLPGNPPPHDWRWWGPAVCTPYNPKTLQPKTPKKHLNPKNL
jgi:hypothetical protein